jgi:hypothetical protein
MKHRAFSAPRGQIYRKAFSWGSQAARTGRERGSNRPLQALPEYSQISLNIFFKEWLLRK